MALVPRSNSPPEFAHTTERPAPATLPLAREHGLALRETVTSPEEASVTLSTASPRRTVNRTPSWAGSLRIEAMQGALGLDGLQHGSELGLLAVARNHHEPDAIKQRLADPIACADFRPVPWRDHKSRWLPSHPGSGPEPVRHSCHSARSAHTPSQALAR